MGKIEYYIKKIENTKDSVTNEEATKTSFILPFLSALGYDVFDPNVIVPEFTADISKKKNEKVDYAIFHDGLPLILIEAKSHKENLDLHATQLERYFMVTDCKFAILTNGIEYRFFTDLEKVNTMDYVPFFVFDMLNLKEREMKLLEKFQSDIFDTKSILESAENKKYILGIKEIFKLETKEPSDDFARLFASKLTKKSLRKNILDNFKEHIKIAFAELIFDMAQEKLNSLGNSLNLTSAETESKETKNEIITTDEELEGFYIVKSILSENVELERIVARDQKAYFGILLDDNNRKWLARLYFNSKQKYLSLRTEDKEEDKHPLNKIEDIFNYKDTLLLVLSRLLKNDS